MRIVLLILLASTASLALIAQLSRPGTSPFAVQPQPRRAPAAAASHPAPGATHLPPPMPPSIGFAVPLTERSLSADRRAEPLDPKLQEAMDRIEPVIDPTRLEGPFTPPVFRIWPGTASLVDAFGEHWRLASDDPNVQLRVRAYAQAWNHAAPLECDEMVKNRVHADGAPALSALTLVDCARVRRRAAMRRDDAAPVPIVAAPLSLAVFAAPLPGARMSSEDFWAAQKSRVETVRDRLQRRWHAAHAEASNTGPLD